jgi:peptidoglycan/xylan/chitin deacetylase (PgdA/CDA1 family)
MILTEPQTIIPETIDIITTDTETTAEETTIPETTEPQTEIVLEYFVEKGDVWIEMEEEPEPDIAVLVTTLVEIPTEPETDSTSDNTDDSLSVPETEPVYYEPIVKPERDDYETNGPYSPVSLMYHSINETPFTSLTGLFVRPVDFEDQLATLNALGYEYLFADEFTHTENPSVMLTFDDGYEDNYTEMFPILKKYNAKATIFMVTSAIDRPGYLSSEQIKEMAESGLVRFASHTHNHYSLTSLSESALRYQFEYSKQILKELTGYEMDAICYPGGSVSDYVKQIAEDYYCYGYTTVHSANTFGCDPMLIPRVRVSRGVTGQGLANLLGY